MGLLFCRFPEHYQPLELARDFKQKMAPIVVDIGESDGFADSIAKVESALDAGGQNREDFQPLHSMKRNAAQYAPQYLLVLSDAHGLRMEGAINRRTLTLAWDDPLPNWILSKALHFTKAIAGAEVEAEDDAGNPIDIEAAAHAVA